MAPVRQDPPEMPEAWSHAEVEAAVADYFAMLGKELRGEAYNKAHHSRQLQQLISSRPRGSIERKHQNISAVLLELGYPYIDGYKPLRNYQGLLRSVVENQLAGATSLERVVAMVVTADVESVPNIRDLLAIEVPPPTREHDESRFSDRPGRRRSPVRRNHLEVKTTRFGSMTPFFASQNEVEASEEREARYRLYRLFNFRAQPRFFRLAGSLRDSYRLDPVPFAAVPN